MRSLLIDTDRLGPVLLREAPRRLERDGSPVTSAEGEPVLMGRLVVPGGAKSAYAENPTPTQVRLKVLGSDRGLKAGVVRLGGRVTVTRWFQRGPQGRELQVGAHRQRGADRAHVGPGHRDGLVAGAVHGPQRG
jgi:hypothetical protein